MSSEVVLAGAVALLVAQASPNREVARFLDEPPRIRFATTATGHGGDPARRAAVSNTLSWESGAFDTAAIHLFARLGWVTLLDKGTMDASLTTSIPGNLILGARRSSVFGRHQDWVFDVGLAVNGPLSRTTVGQPMARVAYSYATAMNGAWDSWLWAQARNAFFFPFRLGKGLRVGEHAALLDIESAAALVRGETDERDDNAGPVLQARARFLYWATSQLSVGAALQSVFLLPSAESQTAANATFGFDYEHWRFCSDWLVNIDAPYGFLPGGQRIMALHLRVEWRPW